MGTLPLTDAEAILANSRILYDASTVEKALDIWAKSVQSKLLECDLPCVALVVLKGGMLPASWLMQRLTLPLTSDYVHASRYRGDTVGRELHWLYQPNIDLKAQQVLLIDDIFDQGYTLEAVADWCQSKGAEQITTAALVSKKQPGGLPREWLDCAALEVPDEYVFGCGMDVYEQWRHLPAIYAYLGPTI